jgi:hypothetical protein
MLTASTSRRWRAWRRRAPRAAAAVLRTYGWRTAAFYPPAVFFVDAHKLKSYATRTSTSST